MSKSTNIDENAKKQEAKRQFDEWKPKPDMIYCWRCGEGNFPNQERCWYCGADLMPF